MELLGKKKWWWLSLSGATIIIGIIALAVWGLNVGIDFTGGTLIEVAAKEGKVSSQTLETVKREINEADIKRVISQPTGNGGAIVKTEPINKEKQTKINEIIAKHNLEARRFESVGPTVGKDLTQKAVLAVGVASLAIILYIAYSFRSVPHPASSWRFGITAVLALIHDIASTVGVFAILSHFLGYEIDALFITALLTVMGFSVHDTIVVFDRLREKMRRSPISTAEQFESATNSALTETLNRSLNTSITTLLVLLALAFLGGETLRPFVVTLIIGIAVGTYSSIFVSAPLLVLWQQWLMRRKAA